MELNGRAIDNLPGTLQKTAEAIYQQTGWKATIIVGGPYPRLGGRITALAYVAIFTNITSGHLNHSCSGFTKDLTTKVRHSKHTWEGHVLRMRSCQSLKGSCTNLSVGIKCT